MEKKSRRIVLIIVLICILGYFILLSYGTFENKFAFTGEAVSANCVNQACDTNRDGFVDSDKSCTGTFKTIYWSTLYNQMTFRTDNWGWVGGEWMYDYPDNDWYWSQGNCNLGTYGRFIYMYPAQAGGRWAYGEFFCNQTGINYCQNTLSPLGPLQSDFSLPGGGRWQQEGLGNIYSPRNNAFSAIFDHQESNPNWKVYGMLNTSIGLFVTVCDHETRRNCGMMLNGNIIYTGGQESIGQGYDMGNGMIIFPAEGQGVVYDNGQTSGTVNLRHSAAAIDYHGVPAFVSSEENGEKILHAETGALLKRLRVDAQVGIPFAAAKIPGTEEWIFPLADNGGDETLVTTSDIVIPLSGASSVVAWRNKVFAAANGKIYEVNLITRTKTMYFDTGSEQVSHMWYDSANDLLWISCSYPDKLFYFDSRTNAYKVIQLAGDEPPPEGSLFDTRVTAGWWARAKDQQGQYYRIEKR